MSEVIDHIKQVIATAHCLFDKSAIAEAVRQLAQQINHDYSDKNILLINVMNGGLILTSELALQLTIPCKLDYLHATRYREATKGDANLEWRAYPQNTLRDQHVIVVDDIYDQGYTLEAVVDYCRSQGALSVASVVLLEKKHELPTADYKPEYIGLQVDDYYVFGYGMDYKGYLRNANGVFAVDPALLSD